MPTRHNEHTLAYVLGEPVPSPDTKQPHASSRPEEERATQPASPPSPQPSLPESFLLRLTITKSTHDKLRQAQALLSHAVPPGGVAEVLDRALDMLITHLRRRKIGGTGGRATGTQSGRGAAPPLGGKGGEGNPLTNSRYIPSPVRRAVWDRDGGQCGFVGADGHRCGETRFLEFDHAQPVARGGRPTVENTRLRCRAHNQYEAERTFGAFMERKRGR